MSRSSNSLPLALLYLLLSLSGNVSVLAAPYVVPARPIHSTRTINLHRREQPVRNASEWGVWAKNHKDFVTAKYSTGSANSKRSSGENLIVNQNADSSFFGSVAVGTPPVAYDVILDTGSSDLWLASGGCGALCTNIATFNASQSSSFTNLSKTFDIQYGSGAAAGSLGQDVVRMSGFEVSNQAFGVVNQLSRGLLDAPVSGLMGLAWQTISSSGAMPFWQTLASTNGTWDEPLMAFQLTRFLNDSKAESLEAGGTFTMGATNSSLYTGDIDYQNIPANEVTYWIQQLSKVTVNGNSVTVPTGNGAFAAIDTGTTLVGGPSAAIQNIYAQIPGSVAGAGNFEGYYIYPCDTEVTIALSFGGPLWSVSPADFQMSDLGNNNCVGAFFELDTGSNAPAWIVGDTFLKNVYSVFRFNPPSVGFAALSQEAVSMNGGDLPAPSPTIGSVIATATSQMSDRTKSSGTPRVSLNLGLVAVMTSVLCGGLVVL